MYNGCSQMQVSKVVCSISMYNNAKKVQAKDLAQEKVVQEREANWESWESS